jgi:hypothetical protein
MFWTLFVTTFAREFPAVLGAFARFGDLAACLAPDLEVCRRGQQRQCGEAHAGMPNFNSGPALQ